MKAGALHVDSTATPGHHRRRHATVQLGVPGKRGIPATCRISSSRTTPSSSFHEIRSLSLSVSILCFRHHVVSRDRYTLPLETCFQDSPLCVIIQKRNKFYKVEIVWIIFSQSTPCSILGSSLNCEVTN